MRFIYLKTRGNNGQHRSIIKERSEHKLSYNREEQEEKLKKLEKQLQREHREDLLKVGVCVLALLCILVGFGLVMVCSVVPGMEQIYG